MNQCCGGVGTPGEYGAEAKGPIQRILVVMSHSCLGRCRMRMKRVYCVPLGGRMGLKRCAGMVSVIEWSRDYRIIYRKG